nr:uncharacterized protein LOC109151131 [Ipomoea batatas]
MAIGNFIGEFVRIDEEAFCGWWKSFIRIRVRLNILKPLVSQMRIRNGGNWSWINFRYERLPHFCFICGLIGHTEMYCPKPIDDPNSSLEKLFGAWLRAPNRRPSLVTGNYWVVTSELTDHKTTPTHGEDVAGTCANSGTIRTDGQSTNCPSQQHVHPTSGTHPLPQGTVSSDVPMQQIDELTFVDPKRKRIVDSWCSLFPNAKANSLLAAKSDHMPLHLQLLPQLLPNSRANFRFESLWLRESHCRNIMLECWSRTQGQSLMDRVGSCGKAIWIWGKHFARNFQRRIDYWRRRMEATKHRRDHNGILSFKEAQSEYIRALKHQSDYWRQRAKQFWLQDGDTNSSFFHKSVQRR